MGSALFSMGIDIETYSETDIKEGLYKYVSDPAFEVMLFGYSENREPRIVVDLALGEKIPDQVIADLFDPLFKKTAYNASFELTCLAKHFMIDPRPWAEQWECTRIRAAYAGYSGSLDSVTKAIGLPAEKQKLATGKALIKKFCVPRKPTKKDPRTRIRPEDDPEAWQLFKEYNGGDVVAEQGLLEALEDYPLPEKERQAWILDYKINCTGIFIDRSLVDGALEIEASESERLNREIVALTGVDNPGSATQMKAWLADELGHEVTKLTKDTIPDLIAESESAGDAKAVEVLQKYKENGKTSLAKYDAMDTMISEDGKLRGIYQFYGARTGRWAGRGVQVHNLPRTYMEPDELREAREAMRLGDADLLRALYGNATDTASELIRTAFIPEPGNIYSVADYSAIEARVIAWLAGEDWRLEVFRTHGKIYEASAAQMFGVPIERIKHGNPEYALRAQGKVAELALGYGGGAHALEVMDSKKAIPDNEYQKIVKAWRKRSPAIVGLWRSYEDAAIKAIGQGLPSQVGCIRFSRDENALIIGLPSGRSLYYVKPGLTPGKYGQRIHFYASSGTSHKWTQFETYGGKLTENIVQAVARDCLSEAMIRLDQAGYPIRFHVHDEVIAEIPPDDPNLNNKNQIEIMCEIPDWAPGLPLGAAGFTTSFYMKD